MIYGAKIYWRWKSGDHLNQSRTWMESYPYNESCGLIRMAPYNGSRHGSIVDVSEIEWKQEEGR
jgi:hypothetical protein